ncbi:maturation protein [ssRNA phage Gerhypos.1_7]|uniref:Maturation protein n=2 Tax=Leviviricetes TaxID=2842243 RepID=A0A8S5L3D0_9VIRU|nr:maturation protein [ssRNA phage Gerhypos.1_7]QDH89810.1 MAG: hypothetical protein H1Bulk29121_000004 [Leviviridae sp.]DAD52184.1 TPA_asm: maturation protein [ssRNA phage Gerhypos.1_7]
MQHYRERSFDVNGEGSDVWVSYIGTPPNWNPPFATRILIPYSTPTYQRKYERMWWNDNREFDWLPYNENYRSQWHPCQHYTRWVNLSAREQDPYTVPWNTMSLTAIGGYASLEGSAHQLLTVDHPSFRSQFGKYGEHIGGLPSMTSTHSDLSFVDAPLGLSALVGRAMSSMMPNIKAELSLVNSLIELKDILTLKHSLASSYRYLKNIPVLLGNVARLAALPINKGRFSQGYKLSGALRKIRSSFSEAQGLTLREIFRSPADLYLQAEFNIMPAMSDIIGIYHALVTLERRLKDLYQRQGRLQRKHFNYVYLPTSLGSPTVSRSYTLDIGQFAGSQSPTGKTGCYRAYGSPVKATREVEVFPSLFHAEIEYRYYFTQFQNEHARILSFLDLMGVNLNPAILWNAIPWSFVVDWVVGIGRWLGDRKSLNMEPGISIERFCWSNTNTRRTRLYIENVSAPTWGGKMFKTYMPDLNETTYRRDVVIPSFTDPLFTGSLSSTELSLGVALAVTRRRHSNLRLRG